MKRALVYAVVGVLAAILCSGASAGNRGPFTAGAPGIGDPYFPLAGNGGYDVGHYLLDINYDPPANHIDGVATITATATQNLSSLNLDLVGLNVLAVTVNGWDAAWTRDAAELTITPTVGLAKGRRFTIVVRYEGSPETLPSALGLSGVFKTDDGMLILGEPDVAATWFPVNDHPLDKASYTFDVTVPAGLEVVANGSLQHKTKSHGLTTFVWQEKDPMASYLATATVGKFAITRYKKNGIRFYDAIDPALFGPIALPTTGKQLVISGQADFSYKRLMRTISVPAGGATLSFQVKRDTEPAFDFMFVEAHTPGADDWTTLPDVNGHTSDDTGFACPFEQWQAFHPFLAHYQTDNGDGTCTATGTTGKWWAVSGSSNGAFEQWKVDLGAYAGKKVELSISYASDRFAQFQGVFIDDVATSTGEGTTSFENDGNTLDGWTIPGPPAGSPGNDNDFFVGTADQEPPNFGVIARESFAREPEILQFLSDNFGPYPFRDAGGIVDNLPGVGFALENQTRPIYAEEFFEDQPSGDDVVVHELAHQWYGDNVSVHHWADIWLNEGFATYAEWLWSEHEGGDSPQAFFDQLTSGIPADDPFWSLVIGDPGADHLLDEPIYLRGAMTLQALRMAVGDDAFFRILRKWASSHAGGNGSTPEFIKLAEKVSGKNLDALFTTWLFTAGRPDVPAPAAPPAAASVNQAVTHALAGRGTASAAVHMAFRNTRRR
jgi:hypothetical protein